ncbi:MAG: hypothetical protein A4E55_02448 [Pelotomaculum sp. PtaU1.Bin035]|nr:MAG: hypothetical protein A4E55_02448 [Pelotomaculum sp. PtaU1.Bin035]
MGQVLYPLKIHVLALIAYKSELQFVIAMQPGKLYQYAFEYPMSFISPADYPHDLIL